MLNRLDNTHLAYILLAMFLLAPGSPRHCFREGMEGLARKGLVGPALRNACVCSLQPSEPTVSLGREDEVGRGTRPSPQVTWK